MFVMVILVCCIFGFMISIILFKNILNRGDCKGDQEWNCKCVSQNDVEVDADISDVEYENFDA